MPGGDGTGPGGMGPMTGRAAGFCAGYDIPGIANPAQGGGYGRGGRGMGYRWGRGRGRGWGRGGGRARFGGTAPGWNVPAPVSPEQEAAALKADAAAMQQELANINERISILERQGGSRDES